MRELEDICDHVGLLHKGGMILSKDLEDMKFHIHKIQCVLQDKKLEDALRKELDVLKIDHQGSLTLITARGQGQRSCTGSRKKSTVLRGTSTESGRNFYQ